MGGMPTVAGSSALYQYFLTKSDALHREMSLYPHELRPIAKISAHPQWCRRDETSMVIAASTKRVSQTSYVISWCLGLAPTQDMTQRRSPSKKEGSG